MLPTEAADSPLAPIAPKIVITYASIDRVRRWIHVSSTVETQVSRGCGTVDGFGNASWASKACGDRGGTCRPRS